MASNFKTTVLISTLIIAFFSCEIETKELAISAPFSGHSPVIHGCVSVENGVQVTVQQSVYDDKDSDVLDINTVKLFENNSYKCTLAQKNEYEFFLPNGLEISNEASYAIFVNYGNGRVVQSEDLRIPLPVVFDNIQYIENVNSYSRIIKYSFKDKPDEKNYYYIKTKQFIDGEQVDTLNFEDVFVYDKVIYDNVAVNGNIAGQYKFNLKNKKVTELKIELYQLGLTLVTFLNSLAQNIDSEGNAYGEIPSLVFSNIDGAYGCFYSYSVSSVYLDISR